MTNAELIDALNRLDALFSDESKWTKGTVARTATGAPVGSRSHDAACWCLFGAAYKVAPTFYNQLLYLLVPDTFVAGWNDAANREFADVKRLIADTRARLEAA